MYDNKKLLFVNQHYAPDIAATGQKLTDLAEYLAGHGHEVTVMCSKGQYLSGELEAPSEEKLNGVRVIRLGATSFGRTTHLKRLFDYASFYVRVFLKLLTGPRYDYTIWLTTPPLLCVAGAALHLLRRQAYGIWSMDLHPDAEEALGMIKPDGALSKILHALNNWGYRKADFVVDLGQYMKALIMEKGVAPHKTHTISMWDRFESVTHIAHENNRLRYDLGLQDKFIVMYSGNAGMAHRFDEVLEAMRLLKGHSDIYFLFVGDGPRKTEIIEFTARYQIKNFQYLDYFPRARLSESLSMANLHLLTLRQEMAGIAVPCKLYGIMAVGRPVVMVGPVKSEPASTILAEKMGHVIDPYQTCEARDHIVSVLLEYVAYSNSQIKSFSSRGQEYLNLYSEKVGCEAWLQLLAPQEEIIYESVA